MKASEKIGIKSEDRLSVEGSLIMLEVAPEQLRCMGKDELLSLQGQLMMGAEWFVLEVAAEQIRPGHVTLSQRSYRIELALREGLDCRGEFAERVWCELMRVAIGMRIFPQARARAKRPSFAYILNVIRQCGKMTRRMESTLERDFWSRAAEPCGSQRSAGTSAILKRLHALGALSDCLPGKPVVHGTLAPRHRLGEKDFANAQESTRQFLPLPDRFVGRAGFAAIFFSTQVGPTLLAAIEAASEIVLPQAARNNPQRAIKEDLTEGGRRHHLTPARDDVILGWQWKDPSGADLADLPMDTNLRTKWRGSGKSQGGAFEWPPRTFAEAVTLLVLLQGCHLWIIAFATAGRHGEVQAMEVDSLRRESSQIPTTELPRWKIEGLGQVAKEVPLPKLVVEVIKQQERLAAFAKRSGKMEGNHLWVQITTRRGSPLGTFYHSLKNFAKKFCLEDALDEDGIHMHRFRKTLVRAVALSLVHAPKVLMDLLGHDDEQMTIMRYILSDPGILAEIQELVREMIILKGVEVVGRQDEIEGAGAAAMKKRFDEYARRLGQSASDPQNVYEFASAMTEGGQGWAVISPGVMCTGFTRGGLCNKGQQGAANPHHCSPACQNQIVLPTFEGDEGATESAVDRAVISIDYMFTKLQEAIDVGEEMLVGQFIGQIKSLMGRWGAVDKHAHEHPLSILLV